MWDHAGTQDLCRYVCAPLLAYFRLHWQLCLSNSAGVLWHVELHDPCWTGHLGGSWTDWVQEKNLLARPKR